MLPCESTFAVTVISFGSISEKQKAWFPGRQNRRSLRRGKRRAKRWRYLKWIVWRAKLRASTNRRSTGPEFGGRSPPRSAFGREIDTYKPLRQVLRFDRIVGRLCETALLFGV